MKSSKNSIPIFLSSDSSYAPFVATTICSIMDHTTSHVHFYVLDGGISELNRRKILDLNARYPNFEIEFLKIDTLEEFSGFPTRLHFSIDMYTRYLIPRLKPELNKVIYSDVDVIFNGDIEDLFREDLSGFALGAVPYTFGYLDPQKVEIESFHKRLRLSREHRYFESGLLLLDCVQWRERALTQKLLETVMEKGQRILLTPDQDALNIVFENNYRQLDNKYIVVPHRKNIMLSNESTRQSVLFPFIYHYAGAEKPWHYPAIEYADVFWKYARQTVFYEELLCNLIDFRLKNRYARSLFEYSFYKILKRIYNRICRFFED